MSNIVRVGSEELQCYCIRNRDILSVIGFNRSNMLQQLRTVALFKMAALEVEE